MDILFENQLFRLVIKDDALIKSLVLKETEEELTIPGEDIPFCTVTQERPYHNEVKLAHPNKRTTYRANRMALENDLLVVGFEIVPYEAELTFKLTDEYLYLELKGYRVDKSLYRWMNMDLPPVAEIRIMQLPIKNRVNFGEWLNVSWDNNAAVNVLASSPKIRIDAEVRKNCRILYADLLRENGTKNTGAALIVSKPDKLLDCIDRFEHDFGLPSGVESRRGDFINASAYWTCDLTPENVDEHIAWAKKGGFRMMLLYYTCMFKEDGGYCYCGNYDYRKEYPNGDADVTAVLNKIKAAGITPGLHFLQTHIGCKSRYVTPKADHRLHLVSHFTLSRPLNESDNTIYVEENPEGAFMEEKVRVLKFGNELISYEDFSEEYPYHFTGCKRGHWDTVIIPHMAGEIGGILDVSEFGATSVYAEQKSDLPDEVAKKIAHVYNLGFQYVYMDGSEGTNAPFEYHVANAQCRVLNQFHQYPLYCEGAAKSHFGWHYMSGGNAFDIFPPEIFKEKIKQYPMEEAPRMKQDFTRLNFGWWGFWEEGTQPDMFEYGTSRAAAWDCPVTLQAYPDKFKKCARIDDIMEVMRRWENVRKENWLTEEQKDGLKNPDNEHILLIDEQGEYKMTPYHEVKNSALRIRAFTFTLANVSYAVIWHASGRGEIKMQAPAGSIAYFDELNQSPIMEKNDHETVILPLDRRRYIKSTLKEEELRSILEKAVLL